MDATDEDFFEPDDDYFEDDAEMSAIVHVMHANADRWNNLDVADQRRLIQDEFARRGIEAEA